MRSPLRFKSVQIATVPGSYNRFKLLIFRTPALKIQTPPLLYKKWGCHLHHIKALPWFKVSALFLLLVYWYMHWLDLSIKRICFKLLPIIILGRSGISFSCCDQKIVLRHSIWTRNKKPEGPFSPQTTSVQMDRFKVFFWHFNFYFL